MYYANPYDGTNEPDDDQPSRRRNCIRCGAFLTKDPTEEETHHYRAWGEVSFEGPDGHRESVAVPRDATQEEIQTGKAWREDDGPWWACPRCGYHHEVDEMWN